MRIDRRTYVAVALNLLDEPPPLFARAHEVVGVFDAPDDPRFPGLKKMRMLRRSAPLTVAEAEEVLAYLAERLPARFLVHAERIVERAAKRERLAAEAAAVADARGEGREQIEDRPDVSAWHADRSAAAGAAGIGPGRRMDAYPGCRS